jgi:hypothetical protein
VGAALLRADARRDRRRRPAAARARAGVGPVRGARLRGADGGDAVRRPRLRRSRGGAERFKRPDGSYRLENQFRYAISARP